MSRPLYISPVEKIQNAADAGHFALIILILFLLVTAFLSGWYVGEQYEKEQARKLHQQVERQ